MSHPPLKLTYFDWAGLGELTRLVLLFGDVPFEDIRVSSQEFAAIKSTLPLGQLPVLDVNGTTYSQSMALVRYAGRISGLYPTDPLDALKVDMLVETLVEGFQTYVDINWRTPNEDGKADKIKKFTEEGLPKIFTLLEKNVNGKFFLGDKASIADVFVFELHTDALKIVFPDFTMAAYPKVDAILATVAANPAIAAYDAKKQ